VNGVGPGGVRLFLQAVTMARRESSSRAPQTVAVEVAPSPLHGRGLFAAEAIEADALILRIEGVPVTRNGPHVLWLDEESGLRVTNEARFVNHSDEPNAAFFELELWSLRPIEPGEEITHDYEGGVPETADGADG
jgi:SET domain-containing protein